MNDFENMNVGEQMPPWINSGAFNTYWTYSFIGRSSFYGMIAAPYYDFMHRWVRQWLYWYDGYVPYFHNQDEGILSTRLAGALVDRTANKVVGGRIMFKNAGKEQSADRDALNLSLKFISGEWAKSTNFQAVIQRAVKYAAAAGTSLIKLNKDEKGLWAEALRFDSFLPMVGARGEVEEVKCFLRPFVNLGVKDQNGNQSVQGYYVVEHRYYGRSQDLAGRTFENVPLVEYIIQPYRGTVTGGDFISQSSSGRILFRNLPGDVKRSIGKAYSSIMFDRPSRLPFSDLGCELVKWTEGIGNIPELPFGESLLSNLISILMSWDYYFSAFNADMFVGRGRVLVPKYMTGQGPHAGMDNMLFLKLDTTDPESQKPVPIQFDLRSASWTEIRNMLIQNIAVQLGLNISTIASFLQDSTARTAREISTEENETAAFVDNKRTILEIPINRILKKVLLYYGYGDDVVIRWSGAGLTNRYNLTELISQAKQSGFLSQYKAIQMFNYDDDDEQVQEEYERIKEEENERISNGFDAQGNSIPSARPPDGEQEDRSGTVFGDDKTDDKTEE